MEVLINTTALPAAGQLIRTHRTPNYFQQADQFIEMWRGILPTPPEITPLLTNLTAGLDELYEGKLTAVQNLSLSLNRLLELDAARAMLQAVMPPTNLQQAIELHLAFFTAAYDRLPDTPLREQWYRLWQQQVQGHNNQQIDHAHMILTAHEFRPAPAEFDRAVRRYMAHFQQTSTLAMVIYASFPFLPEPTEHLLNGLKAVLDYVEPLYRLSLDVHVDLKEALNAGIYGYAAEEGLSLQEAHRTLEEDSELIPPLEARLLALWEQDMRDTQDFLAPTLTTYPELKPLCDIFLAVARRLTTRWKYA